MVCVSKLKTLNSAKEGNCISAIPYSELFNKYNVHSVSKNCAKVFLAELLQLFTNFDSFWQYDGKEAKIMRGTLIFHLT